MDVRQTKQSLFYAAMVKHFVKVVVAGDVLPAGSYPSRRPKAKNLRVQHLRPFVMLFILPRQIVN